MSSLKVWIFCACSFVSFAAMSNTEKAGRLFFSGYIGIYITFLLVVIECQAFKNVANLLK